MPLISEMPVSSRTAPSTTRPLWLFAKIAVERLSPAKVPSLIFPKRSTTRTSPGDEHVNGPGVLGADAPLGLAFVVDHGVHVGPLGHEDGGEHAAHHPPSRIDLAPAALELEL
jgi:hypothetical protein